MARTSVAIEDGLKNDIEIIASVTGNTMFGILDKAVAEYIDRQDTKIKVAIESARKARKQ